jgi:hypothetical protein
VGSGDTSDGGGGTTGNDGSGGNDASFDHGGIGDDSTTPDSGGADGGGDDATNDTGGGDGDDGSADAPAESGNDAGSDGGSVAFVFVSSQVYNGNLGGLAGADTKCQTLATAASLPGTYKAWLSDGTGTATNRLTHGIVPYTLVDNTLVANNWTQLTSGNLAHAIDKTESGGAPPLGTVSCSNASLPHVWTDTVFNGNVVSAAYSCTNWTSTAANLAFMGQSGAKNSQWTQWCVATNQQSCNRTAALYCLQQ